METLYILAVGVGGAILGHAMWRWWQRRYTPRIAPAPEGYVVEIGEGRGGWVVYREGERSARFAWQLAGKEGTLVSWIVVPTEKHWPGEVPWAADRRDEILERIARDVMRQKCATCRLVIGRDKIEMHVRGR